MRDSYIFAIVMAIIGLLWGYLYSNQKEHFKPHKQPYINCLQSKISDPKIIKQASTCFDQYQDDKNDMGLFAKCLHQAGAYHESQECLPELRKLVKASSASGDHNITPNYHMLLSQVSPGDLANTITEKFSGYDPMGEIYGEPFVASSHEISCMGDPFQRCYDKHGTSDWPGYQQCVLSGEGMVKS